MNTPNDLLYAKSHEWLRLEQGKGCVGITDHAQSALSDVVFVELPKAGRTVKAGEVVATVESVKAASDIYSPVEGTIVESNATLTSDPGLINREPYGQGWLFKINPAQPKTNGLLTATEYTATLPS
ncbi:MAG: glycine cleavage system protein H [Verrucomicrobia subdivision 6 bacterium BACL9 MAG-120924-bin69]|jgi:glycine cleavage system H protein|uniref:Glycine cleavage system H protein n=3 Tax=Verrucomicrobia subdivision 6 TaxID=134627 RepID=A0A0R2XBH3_9BACT|nr:MAG: glycine cleavage system protein H [Verrucomicrobia subdivision 6 bacterium BACL9 MAG-120507-bin52]KRP33312.1 MAG: glycine cleavage system protein H [Verrucomicrobia subdivision 6 bacterium BACL9 MAG-120820-bin42]KRP34501.1 MAG: glycine cleavage system protein H [Verrucomicrobia subdivision 6 bacterium BACL9 MAG-120924-bin69]